MMEMQNCTGTLENSMTVPYKVKYTLNLRPNDSNPTYLPERNESKYPHKDFYSSVHNSFIHNR